MEKTIGLKKILVLVAWFLVLASLGFAQEGSYPQLDVSGFKKGEYKKIKMVENEKNYFPALTHLGGYYPTFSGSDWQERLQLRILGQLSENLAVTYDLEQQPESPDRFDIKVKYYDNELTFGDFTANFTGNEFASASKFLNGVMFTAKNSWYDVITVPSAKLKSQTQNLVSQKGNNTKGPYNLGHGSIVEGSERIELNGKRLTKNVDYTIDYFEGKITFNTILTQLDEFKYSYEYTNLMDLFFPSLSKRDFLGFQSRFTIDPDSFGVPLPKEEPVIELGRETFPAATAESAIAELAAQGEYRLKNFPVKNFSEKLNFMGVTLIRNEDYIMRYDRGEIKLLTRFLPSIEDQLIVEYKYNKTAAGSATLPGIRSRGPYRLPQANIAPESETVEVDSKAVVRDLDYTINYETGEITFGTIIGPTSQIKCKYQYNVMALSESPGSKFPKELKIGATYLKETAKKSVGAATAAVIETISASTITSNNNHVYLKNRPIAPSTEAGAAFTVKLDGKVLTMEVDYAIPATRTDSNTGYTIVTPEATLAYINDRTDPSDGYDTGTIKLLNTTTLTGTSQVTVTYTYYKSVIGKYSGIGDNTRGPFYLRNIRNIAPGTETVQVWQQGSSVISTYVRNSSFEADAGDTGYSINYNADAPTITFNKELSADKNFQVIYQYVPPRAVEGSDISQAVYGIDASFKIKDTFKIETAYAKSETDQVFVAETSRETLVANGTKVFALHSPKNIIEESERVYVNQNLLNKDIDYFVSYTLPGQITFYYITPTSLDAIVVEYQYQTTAGFVVGQEKKEGRAYRLGAETKLFGNALTLSGNTKKIDLNFSPMGSTPIALGSRYNDYNLNFMPGYHSIATTYSYKENNNPIGVNRDRFLRSYDNSLNFGVNPNGLARVDLTYRRYDTLDDLPQAGGAHSSDNLQETSAISLTPQAIKRGQLTLTQSYDLKKTLSSADVKRDSQGFSETSLDYHHLKFDLNMTERFSAGFDYQKSEPTTRSLRTSTAEAEELSSRSISTDNSYNFSLDLTRGFLKKWVARVSLLDHQEDFVIKNFATTSEVKTTRNATYHLDFVPITVLTTALDHNQQEQSTVLVGGVNPKNTRTSANVSLSPLSWLVGSWNGTQSEAIPETGITKRTTGHADAFKINWTPLSLNQIKFSSIFSLSDNEQTAPSGTIEGVITFTDTRGYTFNLNINPHPNAPINFALSLDNYKNRNDHPSPASQIDTETQNTTYDFGIKITPAPQLSLSSNYNHKLTQIIKDNRLSPQDREKAVWENTLTMDVYTWGTLVYSQQDEQNGGEIQGGAFSDLDIKKTTQTYSLNIKIPVDNQVLSGFEMKASLKTVDYKNNKNASDNFKVQLTTFEGSLNF